MADDGIEPNRDAVYLGVGANTDAVMHFGRTQLMDQIGDALALRLGHAVTRAGKPKHGPHSHHRINPATAQDARMPAT